MNLRRVSEAAGDAPANARFVLAAFATSNLETIDEHFGSASRLAIFRVTGEGSELVETCAFDAAAQDGNENKLAAKLAAIDGCVAVFCQAAGGSAVRQLMAHGVQPIKVDAGTPIRDTLAWLGSEVNLPTAPWMVKALRREVEGDDPARFDAMADEGWNG